MFRDREPRDIKEGLFWPKNKDAIGRTLKRIAQEPLESRSTFFRSATSEVSQGHITVDSEIGRISVKEQIPSQAYAQDGWKTVQAKAEDQSYDIDLLISEDPETGLAIVTWTSPNPYVASTFGDPRFPGLTLMLIKPDRRRVNLSPTDPSSVDNYDDIAENPDNIILKEAIKKRKPFTVTVHPASSSDFVPSLNLWRETLLGPYINRDELKAVVHIPDNEIPSFYKLLDDTFPNEKIKKDF